MNHHAGMLILESQQHLARISSLLSCHRLMGASLPRAPLLTRHMTSTAISFGCRSLRGQLTTRNEALPRSCKLFSTSTITTCVWLDPRSSRRRTRGLSHSPLLSRGFAPSLSCMAKMPADGVNGSSRDSDRGDGHVVDLSKQQEPSETSDFVCSNMGAIHLIVGPMFAGKTTALLQRVRKEADAGRRVGLVKSDKDTRYGVAAVVSHDGVQMPCVAAPSLATFREHIGEEEYEQMEVIGIDEAQFFDDLLDFCQSAADLDNKTVIVAGLDGDFLRRKFGSALDLIPLADSVTKLHARCELCGQPALFTFRKTGDTKTEVIGGADVYMPVCRHHFVSGQVAVESARTVLQDHQEAKQAHAINL